MTANAREIYSLLSYGTAIQLRLVFSRHRQNLLEAWLDAHTAHRPEMATHIALELQMANDAQAGLGLLNEGANALA